MSAYRDPAPKPKSAPLECCGVCQARTDDGGYGCKQRVGVCCWNEVHPAGISSDHPKGTGRLKSFDGGKSWWDEEQIADGAHTEGASK